MCVWQISPIALIINAIRAVHMQVIPPDRRAPSLDQPIVSMRIGCSSIEAFYRFVRRHLLEKVGYRRWALCVQVAPPKDGLDPPVDTEPSVLPKHDPQLPAHPAFYAVDDGLFFEKLIPPCAPM